MTVKLTKIVEQVEEFDVVYAKDLRLGDLCFIDYEIRQVYRVETDETNHVRIQYYNEYGLSRVSLVERTYPKFYPIVIKPS